MHAHGSATRAARHRRHQFNQPGIRSSSRGVDAADNGDCDGYRRARARGDRQCGAKAAAAAWQDPGGRRPGARRDFGWRRVRPLLVDDWPLYREHRRRLCRRRYHADIAARRRLRRADSGQGQPICPRRAIADPPRSARFPGRPRPRAREFWASSRRRGGWRWFCRRASAAAGELEQETAVQRSGRLGGELQLIGQSGRSDLVPRQRLRHGGDRYRPRQHKSELGIHLARRAKHSGLNRLFLPCGARSDSGDQTARQELLQRLDLARLFRRLLERRQNGV